MLPIEAVSAIQRAKSWSSYWTTRFPSALQAVPYSGTRIDLYWTNNGVEDYDNVSIEISTDGVAYAEVETVATGESAAQITGLTEVTDYWLRVRYIKGASASAYTDAIQSLTYATAMFDGKTLFVGQYEDLSTVTKDGSDFLAEWRDRLGGAYKFVPVSDLLKPKWESDGIRMYDNREMVNTLPIGKLFSIYIIGTIKRFRASSYIIRGAPTLALTFGASDNGVLTFSNGSPRSTGTYIIDTFQVFKMRSKGAVEPFAGDLSIDETSSTSGYVGQGDTTSLAFRSHGAPSDYTSFKVKDIIIRTGYDSGDDYTKLSAYCVKKKLLT